MKTAPPMVANQRRAPVPSGAAMPAKTFEALIFDWDGTAVTDRAADATDVRARVDALCGRGAEVFIVSGTHLGNVDGQLQARPDGPGGLYLCLDRGSEVFRVDRDGAHLLHRRVAAPEEEDALDRAASILVERLRVLGIPASIVSQRLNRRKIDLIPEPRWADPPKAIIDELLAAVTRRLHDHDIADLSEVVELGRAAAREAGLRDPRVTSDVKHVEIGLTDKSDSVRWALTALREIGIGSGLVLIAGDEFGPIGGASGSDALMLVPEVARAAVISVGVEPGGVPADVVHLGGGPLEFIRLLDDQLDRRRSGRVPWVDEDPAWTVVIEDDDPRLRRVHESLLTLADGRFGTRGSREEDGAGTQPLVTAAGLWRPDGQSRSLLPGPVWTRLSHIGGPGASDRSILDLRTGVLARERGMFRSVRFSSLARPGSMVLRAEGGAESFIPGRALRPPVGDAVAFEDGRIDGVVWARTSSNGEEIVAAAAVTDQPVDDRRITQRIASYIADSSSGATPERAIERVREVSAVGFDRLLAEQRAAWAARWRDAEVSIEGDDQAQLAARFSLFHLLSSVADDQEAAVGARGMTGPAYGGRVFWDADVFVLPVLAAVHPASARAMLEYRIRRLPGARKEAAARRRAGALFPWESADDGTEVAPRSARGANGIIPIRTGEHAEHIGADIAWAAWRYVEWTGDEAFLRGPGRPLVTETARYWASRARLDSGGRAHLYGVIGPDEYHEVVDDNAFTNVMARWNLERAAELVERDGIGGMREEAAAWRSTARALVDGYEPATGIYEQFAGYRGLEPLVMSEVGSPPIAADMLLGRKRVAGSQILKQADVLMLHHMIPDQTAPHSLEPNLDLYEQRTAHGSSLSPPIHAALLARAGRVERALDLFRISCRLDLDDLTGTTAAGLHLATLGGSWQALAFGFAGIHPHAGALGLDPHVPLEWRALSLRFRFRGRRVGLRLSNDTIEIFCDGPLRVALVGCRGVTVRQPGTRFERDVNGWREARS